MNKKYYLVFILLLNCLVSIAYADKDIPAYQRSDYKHWIDEDNDCQNTRQEVLIAQSLQPVKLDAEGCRVVSGRWYDPLTGNFYTDPSQLDIDHFIPLYEAHISGAYKWNEDQKMKFANDLKTEGLLIAVYKGANRSKGAKDPSQWLPNNGDYHCKYIKKWVELKKLYKLSLDKQEKTSIKLTEQSCFLRKHLKKQQ